MIDPVFGKDLVSIPEDIGPGTIEEAGGFLNFREDFLQQRADSGDGRHIDIFHMALFDVGCCQVDAVDIFVELVIAHLVLDPEHQQDHTGQANSQPGNIDDGKELVSLHGA